MKAPNARHLEYEVIKKNHSYSGNVRTLGTKRFRIIFFLSFLFVFTSFFDLFFDNLTGDKKIFSSSSLLASTFSGKDCEPVFRKIGAKENSATSSQVADLSHEARVASAKTKALAALEVLESQGDLDRFGLAASYTADQLREAQRKLAKLWHPDVVANLNDAQLTAIHDHAFQLVQQTYERLKANEARRFSFDRRARVRRPREISAIKVDEFFREHSEKFRDRILSFDSEGRSGYSQLSQMIEELEFGRESQYSDPAAFIEARNKILLEMFSNAEALVTSASNIQQLENIILARTAFESISNQSVPETFPEILERRWKELAPQAKAQNLYRFLSVFLAGEESLLRRDSWLFQRMIEFLSKGEGVPASEFARQALVSYIQAKQVDLPMNDWIVLMLSEFWLGDVQDPSEKMQSIRRTILDTPHQTKFHEFLMLFLRKYKTQENLRPELLRVFGRKFLEANGIRIDQALSDAGLFQALRFRFSGNGSHKDLEAANQVGRSSPTLTNRRAAQILDASLGNNQAETRMGRLRVALDSAEVRKISQMSFSRAQKYLRETYGIEVIVMPADSPTDSKSPELLAYHEFFESGPHAVFMPAGVNPNISGYDRKFSDRPVIALQAHAQSSLAHEFAHYLLFEAVGRASDQAGIPHQSLEAYSLVLELTELFRHRDSDLWATPFSAGTRFSEADVSMYIDAKLLAAQRDFQRLRDEIFADQLELRALNLDSQTRQRKIEHISFELDRFEEEMVKTLASLRKRVVQLNAYLTDSETRQFYDAIENLQNLFSRIDEAVLDLDIIGPIEVISQRDAGPSPRHALTFRP